MEINKIKNLVSNGTTKSLRSYLNLLALEDGVVVGVNGDFTVCLELDLPDVDYLGEDESLALFGVFRKALDILKENIKLTFIVQQREGNFEILNEYFKNIKSDSEFANLVKKWKKEQLKESFILKKKIYLFLTKTNNFKLSNVKNKRFFNKHTLNFSSENHRASILELNQELKNFIDNLSTQGIKSKRLNDQEILEYIYQYLNPSRSEILYCKNLDSDQTLRSQVCFNALENNFEDIKTDGVYSRSINLHTRPNELSFDIFANFLKRLPAYSDTVITISTKNQNKMNNKLIREAGQAGKLAEFSLKKNIQAGLKQQDLEEFHSMSLANSEKFYNFSCSVTVHNRSRVELTKNCNETLVAFAKLGESEGIIDDMNHLQLFLAVLPNHSHLNYAQHLANSSISACLVPPSSWKGTENINMLFKADNDELLGLDVFDHGYSSAMNAIILGQQGSGKSFTANYFLTNFLIESENNHVVVIDIGGSYRKLTELVGGSYIELDLSGEYSFNPFPSKKLAVLEDGTLDSDVIEFLTALVQKMTHINTLNGTEKLILEKAITECYAKEKPSLLSFFQILKDFKSGDEEDKKIAGRFAKEMAIWFEGRYSKLFKEESSFDTSARFVAFDLQKLPEELQGIIFFIIQSAIETKLVNKNLKKIIVIDEAWKFFNDDIGSTLIINLYKTIRKRGGIIWSISQSAEDFLMTKASNAIITNSLMKIVLRMQSGFDLLPKFEFSDKEIEAVKNLRSVPRKYNEVFLRFGDNKRVIKIEPSKLDYWICTKNAKDDVKEEEMRAKYPDLPYIQILEKMVNGGS